jgi:hypothetical protein
LKKKSLLLTVLAAGLTGLVLTSTPQPIKAAGVYRTVKSQTANNTAFHWNGTSTEAYLWSYNLTQKKHHLTNYPKTTWYANRVLKMTNGTKTGIFYYVTNQSGNTYGYVWQGYLTKGSASESSSRNETTTNSNTNWTTKDNPDGIPHPTKEELNNLKGADDDQYDSTVTYYQDLPIMRSFTGTSYNRKLNDAAQGKLDNDFGSVTRHEWGDKLQQIKYLTVSTRPTQQQIQELVDGKLTFENFVLSDLKKQGIGLNQYKGWQIGMYSNPIYKKNNFLSGNGIYIIALLAPQYQ